MSQVFAIGYRATAFRFAVARLANGWLLSTKRLTSAFNKKCDSKRLVSTCPATIAMSICLSSRRDKHVPPSSYLETVNLPPLYFFESLFSVGWLNQLASIGASPTATRVKRVWVIFIFSRVICAYAWIPSTEASTSNAIGRISSP